MTARGMLCFGSAVSSASTAPVSNPVNDRTPKAKPNRIPVHGTPAADGQKAPRSMILSGFTESEASPAR